MVLASCPGSSLPKVVAINAPPTLPRSRIKGWHSLLVRWDDLFNTFEDNRKVLFAWQRDGIMAIPRWPVHNLGAYRKSLTTWWTEWTEYCILPSADAQTTFQCKRKSKLGNSSRFRKGIFQTEGCKREIIRRRRAVLDLEKDEFVIKRPLCRCVYTALEIWIAVWISLLAVVSNCSTIVTNHGSPIKIFAMNQYQEQVLHGWNSRVYRRCQM